MFDPELLDLMPFEVTLKPPATNNRFGERTYGAVLTPAPRCHITHTGRQVYDKAGMARTESGVAVLGGVFPVTTEWYMALPDAAGGTTAVEIISVSQYSDGEGYHHTSVSFGEF